MPSPAAGGLRSGCFVLADRVLVLSSLNVTPDRICLASSSWRSGGDAPAGDAAPRPGRGNAAAGSVRPAGLAGWDFLRSEHVCPHAEKIDARIPWAASSTSFASGFMWAPMWATETKLVPENVQTEML